MPVHPTQPSRSSRPVRDPRRQGIHGRPKPVARGGWEYVIALLLLAPLIVLCAAGLFLARELLPDTSLAILPALVTRTPLRDPTASSVQSMTLVTIQPQQGYVNTLVTVTGQGWFAGEPVFVSLRSQRDGDGPSYAYAAAVANERGQFSTALTFPDEMRWIEAEWATVVAQGSRSGFEASARFTLTPPMPTNTLPPPTAAPTAAATDTPLPTNTVIPTLMPTTVVISDWLGEYFANRTLAGEPVFVRNDVTVDFYWGIDPPGDGVPADGFSARWTRSQFFTRSDYHFFVAADDGVRFWIDGQLLVEDWQNGPLRPHAFDLYLPEGEHTLHVEYYENLGEAGMQLGWEPIELPPETLTPTHTVEPSATPSLTPEPTDTPAVMPEPTPQSQFFEKIPSHDII